MARHYHNQQRISDCLAEFDQVLDLASQPAAVELALWFHACSRVTSRVAFHKRPIFIGASRVHE